MAGRRADPLCESFANDGILPSQVRRAASTGERRLMLAVLERALTDVRGPVLLERVKAVDWFASEDARWPYSFRAICDVFDLDPDWVRGRLTMRRHLPAPSVVVPVPGLDVAVA